MKIFLKMILAYKVCVWGASLSSEIRVHYGQSLFVVAANTQKAFMRPSKRDVFVRSVSQEEEKMSSHETAFLFVLSPLANALLTERGKGRGEGKAHFHHLTLSLAAAITPSNPLPGLYVTRQRALLLTRKHTNTEPFLHEGLIFHIIH